MNAAAMFCQRMSRSGKCRYQISIVGSSAVKTGVENQVCRGEAKSGNRGLVWLGYNWSAGAVGEGRSRGGWQKDAQINPVTMRISAQLGNECLSALQVLQLVLGFV